MKAQAPYTSNLYHYERDSIYVARNPQWLTSQSPIPFLVVLAISGKVREYQQSNFDQAIECAQSLAAQFQINYEIEFGIDPESDAFIEKEEVWVVDDPEDSMYDCMGQIVPVNFTIRTPYGKRLAQIDGNLTHAISKYLYFIAEGYQCTIYDSDGFIIPRAIISAHVALIMG